MNEREFFRKLIEIDGKTHCDNCKKRMDKIRAIAKGKVFCSFECLKELNKKEREVK